MEDTDDSLDDWRELMTSPTGLFSGTNLVEIRVGSVLLVENTAADFTDSATPSPCLTIPSGISPNELLDSPVMLPNSQMSPTTGTLGSTPPPPDDDDDNSFLKSTRIPLSDKVQEGGDDVSSYGPADPVSFQCYPPSHNQVYTGDFGEHLTSEDDCQSLVCIQSPTNFEFVGEDEKLRTKNSGVESEIPFEISMKGECAGFQLSSHSYGVPDKEMRETTKIVNSVGGQSLDGIKKGVYPNPTKTSEDGYNWRKYGQKQVKGSEYPRSYYKCTHPTCVVKKKVERSHHGEITEIIYKGAHNHPKPQPTRRSTFGSAVPGGYVNPPDPLWKDDTKVVLLLGSDWKSQGFDMTSSTSVVTQLSEKPVSSVETPELSSTLASHDDEEEEEEDTTTQGSLSVGEDQDDAETESKRRKKETCLIETALGSRALREPRVIVQIESEVDIIDDGYRWRKYGQKVVKGNPNPRSYYKCTSAGCTVRKHVERASHNLKYVLTTYEGKHNHVVPTARNNNNNHMNGNVPPSHSSLTLPRNSHLPKPEPQELVPPFDRKMEYESDFLRTNYLGNLSSAFMKLPSNGLYGGSFGLNHSYTSSAPPMIPSVRDLSMSFPLSLSFPSSFAMGPPLNPVPSFFMGQHIKESDVKVLRPKQELRD